MGENFLNRGYIGIDERISVGGLLTPKTDYLDKVDNARFIEFDFTTLKYSSPIYVNRRASGSYLDRDGWIVTNSNDLRIDHSYTGYTYGLLIEEQRTNYYGASEEFNLKFGANFVGWTANAGATLFSTINGTTGLDNKFTADRGVPVTGYGAKTNNQGGLNFSLSYASLYAKAAELTKLYYGDQYGARFQLRVGVTAGNLIFSSLPTPSQQYISIERQRDNWFRIGVNNDFTFGMAWTVMPYPDGATVFDGYQPTFGNCAGFGMWFWGAQIEAIDPGRAYPTSYIRVPPNSSNPQGVTVTRTQDEITISGTGPTNTIWLKEPGSLYVEYYRREGKGASAHTVISTDNVSQRFICIEHIPSGNTGTLRWETNSLSLTGGVTGLNKAAFTINGSSGSTVQFAFNGRVSGTTATNLIPSNIQWLTLGAKSTSINSGFSDYFNSSIAKIRYYPRVLTSSELQEITRNA
jgi:hypothetical protein